MSGLLLGILLARTVAGVLAEFGGWRTVYWAASGLLVLLALILYLHLPQYKQVSELKYGQLLASIVVLFVRTPVLRVGRHSVPLCLPRSACSGRLWPSCWHRIRLIIPRALSGCSASPVPPVP